MAAHTATAPTALPVLLPVTSFDNALSLLMPKTTSCGTLNTLRGLYLRKYDRRFARSLLGIHRRLEEVPALRSGSVRRQGCLEMPRTVLMSILGFNLPFCDRRLRARRGKFALRTAGCQTKMAVLPGSAIINQALCAFFGIMAV
jgi:hypothetical protein